MDNGSGEVVSGGTAQSTLTPLRISKSISQPRPGWIAFSVTDVDTTLPLASFVTVMLFSKTVEVQPQRRAAKVMEAMRVFMALGMLVGFGVKDLLKVLRALPLDEREKELDELLTVIAQVLDEMRVLPHGPPPPRRCRNCPWFLRASRN